MCSPLNPTSSFMTMIPEVFSSFSLDLAAYKHPMKKRQFLAGIMGVLASPQADYLSTDNQLGRTSIKSLLYESSPMIVSAKRKFNMHT